MGSDCPIIPIKKLELSKIMHANVLKTTNQIWMIKMTIRLPKCDFLTDEIRNNMRDLIRETRNVKKELGFFICDKSGSLKTGHVCSGNECSIEVKDCENIGNVFGAFHTHPASWSRPEEIGDMKMLDFMIERNLSTVNPSIQDMEIAKKRRAITCIGSPNKIKGQEENLACYDPFYPYIGLNFLIPITEFEAWNVNIVETKPICKEDLDA